VNTSLKYKDGTPNFFPLRSRVKDDKVQGISTKIVRGKILYKRRSLELNEFYRKFKKSDFKGCFSKFPFEITKVRKKKKVDVNIV